MAQILDWHARFTQQARWTQSLRAYLFSRADLGRARRVLDVGCGPGALLPELTDSTPAQIHGLDLNRLALKRARAHAPAVPVTCGDALSLPYPAHTFDVTLCHYLLLWVSDPVQALREMKRVTRAGGYVLVIAEPDYTRRIDAPAPLEELGRWQTESLRAQGADPEAGARLGEWFQAAGVEMLENGVLGHGENVRPTPDERELEWAVLESDLTGRIHPADIQKMKMLDEAAWKSGTRRLFVPTHYAWGRA